jgi:HlyD family secretion protein
MLRKLLLAILFLCLLGGGGLLAWDWLHKGKQGPVYRTEQVNRGPLVAKIAATGTIEPEEVIDVGAQVVGQIKTFGKDPQDPKRFIDYCSQVEEGTTLAQLDDSLYQADVASARATVEKVKATIQQTKADLNSNQVKARNYARIHQRYREMRLTRTVSEQEYDQAEADSLSSAAAVETSKAAVAVAEGALKEAEAALRRAETNLAYTIIRSPVKGVVIDRRVNVGQTVVASLSAPSLFLLAKDLTRLQVWASVNEADIGNIKPGQPVTFEVDTFPHEVFKGKVYQIRLNATMSQNVVTYTVVVDTDNRGPDGKPGKLMPYLTANLQFRVAERSDVLLVPNAALRYRPQPPRVDPEHRAAFIQAQRRKAGASPEEGKEPGAKSPPAEKPEHNRATVWVEDGNGFVQPIKIRTGLTDGAQTEVVEVLGGEELPVGRPLVVGELTAEQAAASSTVNPFAPKSIFGGKKQ